MATPSNHWKLGLFVVTGVVVGLGTVVALGARGLHKETVAYESFMDESVQGLEVGSPVKFRGVTIGNVSQIGVAPDVRHVRLTSELAVQDLVLMGLGTGTGKSLSVHIPPDCGSSWPRQGSRGSSSCNSISSIKRTTRLPLCHSQLRKTTFRPRSPR